METYNITFTAEVWYDLWRLSVPEHCDSCCPETLTIEGTLCEENDMYDYDWASAIDFLISNGLLEMFRTLPEVSYIRWANLKLHYTDWQGSEEVAFGVVAEVAKELGVELDAGCMREIAYYIITGDNDNTYSEEDYSWSWSEDSEEWAYYETYTEPDTEAIRRNALVDIWDIKNNEENEESS
eukprot:GHVO01001281.1.p1 GENE.GHVO01001281.1~~GHVO01001281.1.p1  ORF type:complete len:182 (+),score=6.55 GHVO01001281.1:46-591(+)